MYYPSTDYDLSRVLLWKEASRPVPSFDSDPGLLALGLVRVVRLQPLLELLNAKWSFHFARPLSPSALADAFRRITELSSPATILELVPAPRRFFACAPSPCGAKKLARRAWAAYPPTWHLDALDAKRPPGALSVKIAVLDSGADPTHPALSGLLKSSQPLVDLAGHGTHIASTICARPWGTLPPGTFDPDYQLGYVPPGILTERPISIANIAKPAAVFEVDIDRYLIALASFLVDRHQILNLSFGGPAPFLMEQDALKTLAPFTLLVAAAGNDARPVFYPAGYPECLSVAASTLETANLRLPFIPWDRNNGAVNSPERQFAGLPSVDLYAPGRNIAGAERITAANAFRPAGFRSGTSMATACATGVFGLLYSHTTISKPPLQDAGERIKKLKSLSNGGQHLVDLAARGFFQ